MEKRSVPGRPKPEAAPRPRVVGSELPRHLGGSDRWGPRYGDLHRSFEQGMVEVASRWAGRAARTTEAFGGHLSPAWLLAPSFSIRGGTNEVLRGIIARRGLGL